MTANDPLRPWNPAKSQDGNGIDLGYAFQGAVEEGKLERTSKAEEAILLASEPRDVRDYLAKRANKPGLFDPISKVTEAELLLRGDRLIDLSLAEYCLHRETAEALFVRDPGDWPVRALVLSNQALAKASLVRGFPGCLFESDEALLSYLTTVSPDERAIMFSNPSLDESFLEAFLELGKPWRAMDPEQRLWALNNLATNEKLHRKRSMADHDDGWNWYVAGKPFEAAWSLIVNLDPSAQTAKHLGALLRDLPADCYKTEGIAEAIEGWRTGAGEAAKEAEDNANGRLSKFQEVRQAGARLLASRHDAEPCLYLDSDDIALRCGAYEATRNPDAVAIEAAVKRDGELARVHLIRNEGLWRKEKTRDLLLDLVLRGSETEEPRWEFNRRERHYRKEFPAWFEGEDYSEPDERPINESSIADVVAGVAAAPAVRALHDRLAAVEKMQQILIWLVGVALIALAVHAWR